MTRVMYQRAHIVPKPCMALGRKWARLLSLESSLSALDRMLYYRGKPLPDKLLSRWSVLL